MAVVAVFAFERLKIDDPVGALSVHLVNGIWGTLAYGLFATSTGSLVAVDGLLYGGGLSLLGTQAVGIAAVGAFVVVASAIGWVAIRAIFGLRVTTMEEVEGLDIGEHGMPAYDFAFESGRIAKMPVFTKPPVREPAMAQ